MADVSREMIYRIKLTGEEFRLVGLGLAGKLKGRKDLLAAAALNLNLSRVRFAEAEVECATAGGQVQKAQEIVNAITKAADEPTFGTEDNGQ